MIVSSYISAFTAVPSSNLFHREFYLAVISQLGNPGWDWDNLLPYFKKPEKYQYLVSLSYELTDQLEDSLLPIHNLPSSGI